MAKPVRLNPVASGLDVFARLTRERFGLRQVRSVSPDMPQETVEAAPTVVPQAEADAAPFRIVGAQQMCRGKDECQDAYGGYVDGMRFVACIADGAGSSPCSRAGAHCAVAAALESLRHGEGDAEVALRAAFRAAHEAVSALAEEEGRPVKDYRTTLAIAIGIPEAVVAAHVGDSLVVIEDAQGIRPLLRPENGEFGNTTFFVTADDYETHLRFASSKGPWRGLALQTDGLEAVTYWKAKDDLEAATYRAIFSLVDRLSPEDAQRELDLFVSEDAIMDKCNDDLTLVCVVPILRHANPSVPTRAESIEPVSDHADAPEPS